MRTTRGGGWSGAIARPWTRRTKLDTPVSSMRGLYAIVDVGSLSARAIDPVAFAAAVARAVPAAIQLRAKDATARETLALLRAIAPACRAAGVPLYANDRADLAELAACDGVHVGQTDLPVDAVRAIAPGLRVGVSTHDAAQLAAALSVSPSYVAFGPVFATRSKRDPDPVVGLDGLAAAARAARDAGVPLVAIGGIDLARAPAVAAVAPCAAVISALVLPGAFDADATTRAARELHAALGG